MRTIFVVFSFLVLLAAIKGASGTSECQKRVDKLPKGDIDSMQSLLEQMDKLFAASGTETDEVKPEPSSSSGLNNADAARFATLRRSGGGGSKKKAVKAKKDSESITSMGQAFKIYRAACAVDRDLESDKTHEKEKKVSARQYVWDGMSKKERKAVEDSVPSWNNKHKEHVVETTNDLASEVDENLYSKKWGESCHYTDIMKRILNKLLDVKFELPKVLQVKSDEAILDVLSAFYDKKGTWNDRSPQGQLSILIKKLYETCRGELNHLDRKFDFVDAIKEHPLLFFIVEAKKHSSKDKICGADFKKTGTDKDSLTGVKISIQTVCSWTSRTPSSMRLCV